ncbi:MAG: phosphoenolpyruvate carboxykinase (ATP) [Terriglobales bacterium]
MQSLASAAGLDLLDELQIVSKQLYRDQPAAALVEASLRREESELAANGALCAATGKFTGRSPRDRFIVRDGSTEGRVAWGRVNQPLNPHHFDKILRRVQDYVRGRQLFEQRLYAGADPEQQLSVRVVTELAWHALFAHQLLRRPSAEERGRFQAEMTVLDVPGCRAAGPEDGVNSEAFVLLNFERRVVLIGGTYYAGEIKKSVFSALNFLLPPRGVLPMHCSANIGASGDTALFFGLSGTGKTTLSADTERRLIGDDEHGWGPEGIYNFEGGCYAKCIRLAESREPQIWHAIRFGAVLENVVLDAATRAPRYDDASRSENTRAAYPLEYMETAVPSGRGPHPSHVVFLTADAFGVLPPVARLTPAQAMYHFLSGYTAKIAGTEAGVKEPQATFSTGFGAPFLPLSPLVYARMLGERLAAHQVPCWWINTGWSGGGYGTGRRIPLEVTRAIVRAALAGQLNDTPCAPDPVFGVAVPRAVPGVPAEMLQPRSTWRDPAAYDAKARELAGRFAANFQQFGAVAETIRAAGPAA